MDTTTHAPGSAAHIAALAELPDHLRTRLAALPVVLGATAEGYNAGHGGYGFWGPVQGRDRAGRLVMLVDYQCGQDEEGHDLYGSWTLVDY